MLTYLSKPKIVEFPSIHKIWYIKYLIHEKKISKIVEQDNNLLIKLVRNREDDYQKLLQQWTKKKASIYLKQWITRLSELTTIQFSTLIIRLQKTRWGSCSEHKQISLNACLLYLPAELVDYVIIHELCHCIHLNHSKKFWQYVNCFCPNWKSLRKELKWADKYLPIWIKCY